MDTLADHRAARLRDLAADDGWLNLVARIEVGLGRHRVGAMGDIALPAGPEALGLLTLTEKGAEFTFLDGRVCAFAAQPGGLPQMQADPFLLEIHTVEGQPALRVRDLRLPREVQIRYFPDAPDWVIRALWQEIPPEPLTIAQKGGSTAEVTLTHRAQFVHQGRDITLTPTHWKGGKPMFVFRDATAGRETYGAARFLLGEDAGAGQITLDFNRAFNPPCAYTDFAICPLPPPGNVLPFRVEAGELAP